MPPKQAGKAGAAAADGPGGIPITTFADVLKGDKAVPTEPGAKPITRLESATRLWSHALTGEAQREEVFKAQVLPALVYLLERGHAEERWAACGALHALAQSEKHVTEVVSNKVIMCAAALLSSTHDRSRQPAAQLLAFLAQRLEYSARVSDAALLPLLGCCTPGAVAAWAGARVTALHAVVALRALVENVQGEASHVKTARRNALIAAGAIPHLAHLVTYAPRMPEPHIVPAFPPAGGKKPGAGGKAGGKSKKGGDVRPPAGRKDTIATHAAACLRFLALCPHFRQELLASGSLPGLVRSMLTGSAEQQAYVCGILWEMTADHQVVEQVVQADGVKCALHVVSTQLQFVKPAKKKAKKAGNDAGSGGPKKSERADPTAPPNYSEIAVCNAAGLLHHLTFQDAAKEQVALFNGVAILLPCLKLSNIQLFENATGALWNAGLHPANTPTLLAAGAPMYLAQPVPPSWAVLDPDVASVGGGSSGPASPTATLLQPLEMHAHAGPSFFVTQAN